MTLLTLDENTISSEEQEERALMLGVMYDADFDKHLEGDGEIGEERERLDDQIFAGLVCPW